MSASHAHGPGDPLPGHDRREARLGPMALRGALILLVTTGGVVTVAVGWSSPIRVVLALSFFLFAPGLALAELLEIRDIAQRLAIAPAASLGLETLLAITLVYSRAFSIDLAVAILGAFTVSTLSIAFLRALRARSATSQRTGSSA